MRTEIEPIRGEEVLAYVRAYGKQVTIGNPWSYILFTNPHEMKGEIVGIRNIDEMGNSVHRISATETMVDHLRQTGLLY